MGGEHLQCSVGDTCPIRHDLILRRPNSFSSKDITINAKALEEQAKNTKPFTYNLFHLVTSWFSRLFSDIVDEAQRKRPDKACSNGGLSQHSQA